MTFNHIFGANKKEVEIRLIAVRTKLKRLISKFGFKPISQQLGLLFRSYYQLGYASKGGGGGEAAAHAVIHILTMLVHSYHCY